MSEKKKKKKKNYVTFTNRTTEKINGEFVQLHTLDERMKLAI